MGNLDDNSIKLAIQKEGRLTQDSISLLRSAGLDFDMYKQHLFARCRNFPLEVLYVRDDDIPNYVASGAADLGIVGQNIVFESRQKVKKLLNLRFGFCSLVIAILEDSTLKKVNDLHNLKVATSYPNCAKEYFKRVGVTVDIVTISGSVEIAPALGIASAVVDIVATGSTLATNNLKILEKISDSEAVLIATPRIHNDLNRKSHVDKITSRIKTVLSAKNYKFVSLSIQKSKANKLKRIVPALKLYPTLAKEPIIFAQALVKEDILWDTLEKAKELGASGIIVTPIENVVS